MEEETKLLIEQCYVLAEDFEDFYGMIKNLLK